MANLIETAKWETGIYQLEEDDEVLGGAEGVDNRQAKQLANRTLYLKQEVEKRAKTESPTFTGSPKAPTPLQTVNDTTIATTAFVKAAIAALVGSAPATLDTLAEIAASLGSDGNLKNVLLAEIGKKANATHTHTMANITDLAPAMNAKANLASPTFTGSPKAPTPAQTVNDTTLATTAFVKEAIAALIGSAPAALDTLAEIATSLANDGNIKQTLLTEIGKKANASHTHTMSQITDFELKNLSTEDLDTVKKAGMYGQMATVNATTARHYPEATVGALLVMPSAYGWMQIYIAHSTYRIYIRNANNSGGWLSWVRMDGRDKADIASPTFTGSPKAPTPAQTVNDTTIATTAFVKSAIAALVGSAPAALDTLAEIATALGSDGNLKNTLLTEIGKKANQTDFTTFKNLLIGIPFPYPLAAVPSGCLAFNGQAFNKTTYPILAQKYPSGVLPDLRGEFIRGWDNGRGVDSGRGLLSGQGDEFRSHNHGLKLSAADDLNPGYWITSSDTSAASGFIDVHGSVVGYSGGSETRPRNIAFQYICLAA